ncbi:hypothetical protein AB0I61_17400 [Polymorphospora rubra]|uniref:hypothetical protein n=1 Tax=Polymorphospora rubra TaxID=338584 RepID=UPI00340483EC
MTVTADAIPHTPGAWVELVAATAMDYSGLTLRLAGAVAVNGTDTSILATLGLGAPGAEQPWISGICLGHSGETRPIPIPVRVPAGVRISARIQAVVASDTADLALTLHHGGGWHHQGGWTVTTYGANLMTSGGVPLAPPGGAHTPGAWTEIVAATSGPMWCMVPLIAGPPGDTSWAANHLGLIDIGVGAVGAEQVLVPNIGYQAFNNEALLHHPQPVGVHVPAGSRLVARNQAGQTLEAPSVIILGVE